MQSSIIGQYAPGEGGKLTNSAYVYACVRLRFIYVCMYIVEVRRHNRRLQAT